MPFCFLKYVNELYEELINSKKLYSEQQIPLPVPKFVVFYNGSKPQPERKILKLSDAFSIKEEPTLELKAVQLNINKGYNEKLLESCPLLLEYMTFVDKVRKNQEIMDIQTAVEMAVEECIRSDVLKEFLLQHKKQVVAMSIFEYDEELHKQVIREEAWEYGREEGRAKGREEGKKEVIRNLYKMKMPLDQIAKATSLSIEKIKEICKEM